MAGAAGNGSTGEARSAHQVRKSAKSLSYARQVESAREPRAKLRSLLLELGQLDGSRGLDDRYELASDDLFRHSPDPRSDFREVNVIGSQK